MSGGPAEINGYGSGLCDVKRGGVLRQKKDGCSQQILPENREQYIKKDGIFTGKYGITDQKAGQRD